MTVCVGLIGEGIQGSKSPGMHEAEAAALGFDLSYVLFDTRGGAANLPDSLDYAQGAGFLGVNITYPFKQAVMGLIDELADDARAIGAVNTVVFKDGRRIGHNTDCFGYSEGFRRGLPDARKKNVIQLGAGGAGAAVGYALLSLGVERLVLFDLDQARAADLAASLNREFENAAVVGTDLAREAALADGLVNATPVGMTNIPGMPVEERFLRPDLWVSDVVYVPLETELLKTARRIGCRTIDGGGMAVFQAVEAFRLFNGIQPDAERMLARFRKNAMTAAA